MTPEQATRLMEILESMHDSLSLATMVLIGTLILNACKKGK